MQFKLKKKNKKKRVNRNIYIAFKEGLHGKRAYAKVFLRWENDFSKRRQGGYSPKAVPLDLSSISYTTQQHNTNICFQTKFFSIFHFFLTSYYYCNFLSPKTLLSLSLLPPHFFKTKGNTRVLFSLSSFLSLSHRLYILALNFNCF